MASPKEVDAFDALIYRSKPGTRKRGEHEENRRENTHSQSASFRTPYYSARPNASYKKMPPKTILKFFIHEEVSSVQEMKNNIDDISCHVHLEGTIHCQIISSETGSNPPVALRLSDPDYPEDNYQFDTNFMTYYGSGEFNTLSIPKAVMGQVKVATYQRTVTKKFMPLLVQSK